MSEQRAGLLRDSPLPLHGREGSTRADEPGSWQSREETRQLSPADAAELAVQGARPAT